MIWALHYSHPVCLIQIVFPIPCVFMCMHSVLTLLFSLFIAPLSLTSSWTFYSLVIIMWIAIVSLSCSVWALSSRFKASIYGRVYDLGSRTFFLSLAVRFRVLLATISSELIVNCTSFSILYILYLNLKRSACGFPSVDSINEILIFPQCGGIIP